MVTNAFFLCLLLHPAFSKKLCSSLGLFCDHYRFGHDVDVLFDLVDGCSAMFWYNSISAVAAVSRGFQVRQDNRESNI